ncbi:MAG TPA: PAS domain S-box protein, partial [Salinimicrobium sp.]|nr:PAS domain S-box protein [Salinimicrobium sp.]
MEKKFLEQLFQHMPSPCFVLKPEGNIFSIVDVNNTLLEKYNFQKESLIGKEIWEAFPPVYYSGSRERSLLQKSFEKILMTKAVDKIGLLRYDLIVDGKRQEKYWNSENIPILDEQGNVALIIHCVREITDQVKAAKKQREYQYYVEENSDGIYSLDRNGNFTTANEGLAKMAELPLKEVLQGDFLRFCAPQDKEKILKYFKKTLEGESCRFEADFISAKGTKLVLHISLMPMESDGEIVGAYGIARNYTRIRNTEKIVVEKSKFLEVNASFISSLLEKDLNEVTLQKAFAVIGEAVAVDRMYYFRTHRNKDSGKTLISQIIEWTSKETIPQIDNPEMQNIPADQLEEIMGPLSNNIPFISTLSQLPECGMKEIFIDQDIKSMLLLPIFFKENLYGFIGFDDCTEERQWSNDEITFLKSLAYNLTTALEKRTANQSLKQREEELIKSEKKFKALVQAGTDLIG